MAFGWVPWSQSGHHAFEYQYVASDAITIARCRELLADEAAGLSDEDIDRIRRHADAMARVIVEMFLEQRAARE